MGIYFFMAAIGWWLAGPIGALLGAAFAYPIGIAAYVCWQFIKIIWELIFDSNESSHNA